MGGKFPNFFYNLLRTLCFLNGCFVVAWGSVFVQDFLYTERPEIPVLGQDSIRPVVRPAGMWRTMGIFFGDICWTPGKNGSCENIWMFPKIVVPPNHPILIEFSIINHPFWVPPIFGNTHISAFFPHFFGVYFSTHIEQPMGQCILFDDCVPCTPVNGPLLVWQEYTQQ